MEASERYASEIRDYLVGRLAKHRKIGHIEPHVQQTTLPAPCRRWWMLEGKRYEGLEGALCQNWSKVAAQALRLLSSFNPRWRALEQPEGRVDWTRTLQRSLGQARREYICDTTHMGLNTEEHQALKGWISWILNEWKDYTRAVDRPQEADSIESLALLESDRASFSSDPPLRRWAHAARRSRWPLLRNVVAESLRCSLEAEELDKLPLPEEHYMLFELFCMVRILRHLVPAPTTIRWLMTGGDGNVVVADNIRCRYQHSFSSKVVLGSEEFAGPLAEAMEVFRVRVPSSVDLLFSLENSPFDSILVEVKSGLQKYYSTLLQLKAYRAAMRRGSWGRTLIWGIVENPDRGMDYDSIHFLRRSSGKGGREVWAFSGADEISGVLQAVGVSQGRSVMAFGNGRTLAS